MSTRSVIARPHGDGFTGRYHHWDGYPDGLGSTLYELAQPNRNRSLMNLPPTPWDGDTDKMLAVLIDQHPAGWSTINGKDMRLKPGFTDAFDGAPCIVCGDKQTAHLCQNVKDHGPVKPCKAGAPARLYNEHLGHVFVADPQIEAALDRIPQCYCHGSRSEDGWDCDDKNAAGSGCEYAYVIRGRHMTVLSSFTEFEGKTVKMIGAFGSGAPDSEWKPIGVVDLDGPEPDWAAMYKSQYPEEVEA